MPRQRGRAAKRSSADFALVRPFARVDATMSVEVVEALEARMAYRTHVVLLGALRPQVQAQIIIAKKNQAAVRTGKVAQRGQRLTIGANDRVRTIGFTAANELGGRRKKAADVVLTAAVAWRIGRIAWLTEVTPDLLLAAGNAC